jgi:hypothetical protein
MATLLQIDGSGKTFSVYVESLSHSLSLYTSYQTPSNENGKAPTDEQPLDPIGLFSNIMYNYNSHRDQIELVSKSSIMTLRHQLLD